jgi:predicted transposase/invertase (TIGR01784 family)
LLAFIDAILRLPEDQEKIFKQEIFDNQRGDDHMGLSIERSNLARLLRADGKIEGKAEVAAKMISMNLPEEVIAEATELTIEQIKELKEKEQN